MLDIDKANSDQKLISEEVNETVMEHILAGIEIISGRARGSHYLNVSRPKSIYQKFCTVSYRKKSLFLERI